MAIKSFYLHGKMIFAFQMMDNGDEANVHICYSFGSARKRFTRLLGAPSDCVVELDAVHFLVCHLKIGFALITTTMFKRITNASSS